jgi:hypothetical protein
LEEFLEDLDLQKIEKHLVFSDLDDGDEDFVPQSGMNRAAYSSQEEDEESKQSSEHQSIGIKVPSSPEEPQDDDTPRANKT